MLEQFYLQFVSVPNEQWNLEFGYTFQNDEQNLEARTLPFVASSPYHLIFSRMVWQSSKEGVFSHINYKVIKSQKFSLIQQQLIL